MYRSLPGEVIEYQRKKATHARLEMGNRTELMMDDRMKLESQSSFKY